MNLGKFIWGLIVVLIGLGFLLVNFNIVEASIFANVWRLWPIILVIIGLSILSNALSKWASIIINILLILAVIGSFLLLIFRPQVIDDRVGKNIGNENASNQDLITEIDPDAKSAEVNIITGAAELKLDGVTTKLLEANIKSNVTTASLSQSTATDKQSVQITANQFRFLSFRGINDWQVHLTDKLPLALSLQTGAISATLDLTNIMMQKLDVKSGASTYDIRFGDKIDLQTATVSAGASTIKLRVPKNVAVKITNDSGLSSNNFERQGLNKSDKVFTTDGYDQSAKKIEISLKTGASTLELDRY